MIFAVAKIALLSLLVLVVIISLIEPYFIQLVKTEFYSKKLPPSFDGMKMVFVSDIHHGPTMHHRRLKKIVKIMNSTNAEIALFGGDYVCMAKGYLLTCFNEFKNLDKRMLKYGVLGNHDHWESAKLARRSMRGAGINLLDNKAEWLYIGEERIRLGGLGDLWEDTADIAPTLEDIEEDDFVVVISHNPDAVEALPPDKVDLMIAGHTHGGQIILFKKWLRHLPSKHNTKYMAGLMTAPNNTTVLVSNGAGTGAFPGRFFARPQINLVILRTDTSGQR